MDSAAEKRLALEKSLQQTNQEKIESLENEIRTANVAYLFHSVMDRVRKDSVQEKKI